MPTMNSVGTVTLNRFIAQVCDLEGVKLDIGLVDTTESNPKLPRVISYPYDRKLNANAPLRQLITRIRTCLASNGDLAKASAVLDMNEGLAADEAMIKGKHRMRIRLFKTPTVPYTRSEIRQSVLCMGDARRWEASQAKGKAKPATEAKPFTGFQAMVTEHIRSLGQATMMFHTDKKAAGMDAGEQMEAMRGMLAQFIHTPRSGQKKADCLPTEPVAALEFLLKHYLATGAGSLNRENNPPKEVVKGIDKLYAEAFPNGDPEHMDDHIPEDFLLLFWNINKYRFGVGHPLTIYKKKQS